MRGMARRLNRSVSTISNEFKKGGRVNGEYVAIRAQRLSDERKNNSYRRHPLKNDWLYAYVHKKLRAGWSPEQISGRLKRMYPKDRSKHINHETIYRFTYDDGQADKRLWEYLPRKQKKRRKRTGRKVHRSRIPDRVSIHQRPVSINERTEFGHWEGDTVEGKRSIGDGIHTEAERLSRKLMARKINRVTSEATIESQLNIFMGLPEAARLSTTLDNGKEQHLHMRLDSELGVSTFFADPYSSWQRGTNEYHNGLLRRYLPKGTDFRTVTEEELSDIVEEINNKPRKCLDFATPNEVFLVEVNKIKQASVRIEN